MAAPEDVTRSKWVWLYFAGVTAAVCLFIWAPWRPSGDPGWRMGDGYATKVNKVLIAQELLRAESTPEGPEIRLAPEAQKNPAVEDFLARSRLQTDMDNSWSDIWNIQNGKVISISPDVHRVALPTPRDPVWTGEILFSGTPTPQSRLLLKGETTDLVLEAPDFGAPKGKQQELLLFTGVKPKTRRKVTGSPVRLQIYGQAQAGQKAQPRDIAEVYLVGSTPVVATVGANSDLKISVGDAELGPGERKALPPGGRLVIEHRSTGRTETFQAIEEVERTGAISARRLAFERQMLAETPDIPIWQRSSDRRRAPGYEPFAYLIEQAMTSLVRTQAESEETSGPSLANLDLKLTIDQSLDAELRGAVNDLIERVSAQRPNDWKDFLMAVTVMDAMTGDIVAMTSVEKAGDASETRRQSKLPPEVNFRTLPVGSTAKPLVASAILEKHRDLMSLEIMPTPPEGPPPSKFLPSVLDAKLAKNSLISHAPGRCNFDCFIQVSDNQYAATLMLLAAAPENANTIPITETYYLGGVQQNTRKLSIFEDPHATSAPPLSTAGAMAKLDWDNGLNAFYDLAYESPGQSRLFAEAGKCASELGPQGDDRYDMRIWRNFYTTATQADPCAFRGVSPARENFLLDRQVSFQQGMLQAMIGGGEARWTNVKLAESYARLVTGRKVTANLIASQASPPEADPLGMNPGVRQTVTHAMTLVTQPGGTGDAGTSPRLSKSLTEARDALEGVGGRLGFFSKTGTPQLEVMQYQPWDRAVNRLIGTYKLRLGPDNVLRLYLGGDPIPPKVNNRQQVIDALRQDRDASRIIREESASYTTIAQQLGLLNTEDPAKLRDEFVIRDPYLLVSRKPPDTASDDDKRFGKAYVFVAGRYPVSTSADEQTRMVSSGLATPTRAFAVAINIQNRTKTIDDPLALDLAADILARLLTPQLLDPKSQGGRLGPSTP